jgi:hypothetical protein
MSITVRTRDTMTGLPRTVEHAQGESFTREQAANGTNLIILDAAGGEIATYAAGCWDDASRPAEVQAEVQAEVPAGAGG